MVRQKVTFDPDKDRWRPSVLPGQIVVVSTLSTDGTPNLAPKSWISMAAFAGPVLAFGCNVQHTTYANIAAGGEFVVNIPSEALVDRVWSLIEHHGVQRLQHAGLTLVPAQRVRPPLVQECRAHLECTLCSVQRFGDEVMVFGQVVAASIDAECQAGEPARQYFALRPVFFLEDGIYGSIDTAKRVRGPWPAAQDFFVVQLSPLPERQDDPALVREHDAFLQELRAAGRLLMAGPFLAGGAGGAAGAAAGGMYIVSAGTQDEAGALARRDPLVRAGAPFTLRTWQRRF